MYPRSSKNPSLRAWTGIGKLEPPHTLQTAVRRAALLDTLHEQSAKPLTLVVSPPGFGKTTLLSQWRDQLLDGSGQHLVAWLSLDEADADNDRFLSFLTLALERAGLDPTDGATLAQSQDPRPQSDVAALLDRLAADGRAVVLVLDDYHRAASKAVDDIVMMLLERAGISLRLVVAARSRPEWPLAALRARGLVHEIDAGDLTLSLAETALVLGSAVEQSAVATVHSRTEGWAVAVQLARLWLTSRSGSKFGPPSFSGCVAEVAEYLAEQIFDQLPADCQVFLLETSLLERFNAELADAARGRDDSRHILTRLGWSDALLVPLDADGSWYRYHVLLTDFLRPRLDQRRAQQIHRAAAGWLAKREEWSMAISHALKAGDTPLALHLLHQAGGWELVLRKGIPYADSLLRQFDELTRHSSAELILMQAYLQAKLGNRVLAFELLRLARNATQNQRRLQRDYDVVRMLVETYFDQFGAHSDLPADQQNNGSDTPPDPFAQALLTCSDVVGLLARGSMESASSAAAAARMQMRIVDSTRGENYCLMHEAIAVAVMGQVSRSRKTIDEALTLAEHNLARDTSVMALVNCFKAQHVYWEGKWSEALRRNGEAQQSIEHADGWLDVFVTAAEVSWRAGMREHGIEHAIAVLDHTSRLATDRQLHRLEQLVGAWRVDLLSQCGFVNEAKREARTIGLESALKTASPSALSWRFLEAGTLALGRLLVATGASTSAVSHLKQGADAFDAAGAHLPALRMRLLALTAQRKAQNGDVARTDVQNVITTVLRDGLYGLFLEVGPSLLPVFNLVGDTLPPTVLTTLTQLRAWRAHPVRPCGLLSIKETQVLALLATGQSNKEIARSLDVSENTVKFHLKHIFQKLDVENRAAAISAALQQRILTSPA